MKIEVPKAIAGLIALAVVFAGAGILIGQMYGKAQGTITGTIVLADKETEEYFAASIALPGNTCNVILMHCGPSLVVNAGGYYQYFLPTLVKSAVIAKAGGPHWDSSDFELYVPVSQPLGPKGDSLGNCLGAEYRDLPSGNYIVGTGYVRNLTVGSHQYYDESYVNIRGQNLRNVTVSYVCSV